MVPFSLVLGIAQFLLDTLSSDDDPLSIVEKVIKGAEFAEPLAAVLFPDRANKSLAARHLTLTTACFGQAFRMHWAGAEQFAPQKGWRPFSSSIEARRRREIEARMRAAVAAVSTPGTRPAGMSEVLLADELTGSPLDTSYYRALWDVFSDQKSYVMDGSGEAELMFVTDTTRRQFERHFLLVYWDALNTDEGEVLRSGMSDMRKYRQRIVHEMLLGDVASFGARHVFGNAQFNRKRGGSALPFMPLEQVYVEPQAKRLNRGGIGVESGPILSLLEKALADEAAQFVTFVTGHFGTGKSLTARKFCQIQAERWLKHRGRAADVYVPVYIRCAEDLTSDSLKVEDVVRRAWQRQANDFGLSLKARDDAFVMPTEKQRTVFVLDGLDEVSLGPSELNQFLTRVRDEATDRHRFVLFSRPGGLPVDLGKRGPYVLELEGLQQTGGMTGAPGAVVNQIGLWLEKWNSLEDRPNHRPITFQDIKKQNLIEIARTPILLLMIVQMWDEFKGDFPGSAAMYERFFQQSDRGKHADTKEDNAVVVEASQTLHELLQKRRDWDKAATPWDAMLWLMGRIVWEASKLAQSMPPERLHAALVDELINEELQIDGAGPFRHASTDSLQTIRTGLLLALQANLDGSRTKLLFGHESFRHFLIGRFWAHRLRAIVRAQSNDRAGLEKALRGGRLLGEGTAPLDTLMQMIEDRSGQWGKQSPFSWTAADRERLLEWCQHQFEGEQQDFTSSGQSSIRCDQRAALREAALAIGSLLRSSSGIADRNGTALRSMLGWFWTIGKHAEIIAEKAKLQHAQLAGADLRKARFFQADLTGAKLLDARLEGIRAERICLQDAQLDGANLDRSILDFGDLRGASALGSTFVSVRAQGLKLANAQLRRARFDHANLYEAVFTGANLQGTSFVSARLTRANMVEADLRGADFRAAQLDGASLQDALYNDHTIWPDGFDPKLAGAKRLD